MNISLTPELEKYIQDKVESGLYTSASEVVRESLRLMHSYDDIQKQRFDQLNQAIEVGLTQLRSGQKIPASESYQRLKQKIKNATKDRK
jgi:antitoxin ParD1/3/4